jgi:phenol/toluene 2-monooxygenase (NADH) P1/A1
VQDPFELFVAQNLALDGLLYPLIYGSFVDDHMAMQGGTAVAMLTAFMPEWHDESARWVDAVVKTAAAESDANRSADRRLGQAWTDRAQAALAPVAELALGDAGQAALATPAARSAARCRKAGVPPDTDASTETPHVQRIHRLPAQRGVAPGRRGHRGRQPEGPWPCTRPAW